MYETFIPGFFVKMQMHISKFAFAKIISSHCATRLYSISLYTEQCLSTISVDYVSDVRFEIFIPCPSMGIK